MDKDRAIITQVAAKIAAELVNTSKDTTHKLGEFTALFMGVKDIIFDAIDGNADNAQIYELAKKTFNATEVGSGDIVNASDPFPKGPDPLEIAGQQHGEIPEWLIRACKRDGITKVWDNRDGLSVNPKRPWFKAVDADKAYWPPRTKTK